VKLVGESFLGLVHSFLSDRQREKIPPTTTAPGCKKTGHRASVLG